MRFFVLAVVLLLTGVAGRAQEPANPPPQQEPAPPPEPARQEPPLPRERREPEAPPEQPVEPVGPQPIEAGEVPERIGEAEAPPETPSDYGGPAILSRGGIATVRRGDRLRIRPFATVEGIYDTYLATVSEPIDGKLPQTDGYGVQATFGINGGHSWPHSTLNLDYRGSARHYTQATFYDGSDHALILGFEHQLNSKWAFGLSEAAASYSRPFSLPAGMSDYYEASFNTLTGTELFDTRTNALMTAGQLVYQATARLSFGMGGNGFVVRRRSEALIGANGWGARGDVAYRLNRRSTLSADYTYDYFDYQHTFGQSDMHGAAVGYAVRIGRYWEIALRAGGYRVETSRLQRVELDPVVAAIFGRGEAVETFHGIAYLPRYEARVTRHSRRGSFTGSYSRVIGAGNGVYLTSTVENGTVAFDKAVLRRFSTHLDFGHSRYRGLSQQIGRLQSYWGAAGAGMHLTGDFWLQGRFEARSYNIPNTALDRLQYRVTAGIAWSPADFPLSIW